MRQHHHLTLLAAALLFLAPKAAFAWERVPYEDAQVVQRSTLIVIAHIKPGSLQYIPLGPNNAWEFHATLVISQSLKGKPDAPEIPFTLFYGIEPLVEGKVQHDDRGQMPGTFPKNSIQLEDHADMAPTICADATQDNLWLLQQRTGDRGETTGTGNYGIADPQEIQPIALLDYFKCYLAPDPEAAVKAFLPQHPDVAQRGNHFLQHMELQHALEIKDPAQRVEKILPFFTHRSYWGMKFEASDALIAAGADAAGPPLLKWFNDPDQAALRPSIMNVWTATHYQGCVDTLIALLRDEDQYWSSQKLEAGWWSDQIDPALTQQRQNHYADLIDAVRALGSLRDPRTRDALEQTLTRWRALPDPGTQIVEETAKSLKDLPAK